MTIPVISNIVPQNDNPNFGVAKDTDLMGGWRSVADVAALLAIPVGRRLEGMHVWSRATEQLYRLVGSDWHEVAQARGLPAWAIWVDSTSGDDGNVGTESAPIASLAEAFCRIPLATLDGIVGPFIKLKAGTFPVDGYSELLSSITGVTIEGTRGVISSHTISTVNFNAVQVSPDPAWATNSLVGKQAWWPTTSQPKWIIANTNDTLTLGDSFVSMGGFVVDPVPGATLTIEENLSRVVSKTIGDNALLVAGAATIRAIQFDGEGTGYRALGGTNPATYVFVEGCDFLGWTGNAVAASGYIVVQTSLFSSCHDPIAGDIYTYLSRNVFIGCDRAIINQFGYMYLNYSAVGYYINCTGELLSIGDRAYVRDGSVTNWIDNCVYYGLIANNARYAKEIQPLKGWTGKDTFTARVLYLYGSGAQIVLVNSQLSTMKPDATYFAITGPITSLSLANYVAGGKAAEFQAGMFILG